MPPLTGTVPDRIFSAMAILKIAKMGHAVLARKADPVAHPPAPEIRALVEDMVETLDDIGGVGLAAPQVHAPLRVVIFEVPEERPDGDTEDRLVVLVNPVIEPLGDEIEVGWEGCLSVPGLRGAVPRHRRIRYHAQGLDGRPILCEAEGFHARVAQHECDHLDGILYPMRMPDLSSLHFLTEARFHAGVAGPEKPEVENADGE